MRRVAAATVLLLWGGVARAGSLDFDIHPGGGHLPSIAYAGGNQPLTGTDLFVNSVLGEGTPLQDGTSLSVLARLDFTTGNLVGMTSDTWEFGGGGSFTIIGTVPGLILTTSTLFSGEFVGNSTVLDLGSGIFKVIGASVRGTLDATLAQYFGLPTQGPYEGGVSLLFHGPEHPSTTGFVDPNLNSGNLAFLSVPEPPSLGLSCLGIVVLTLARKTRTPRRGTSPACGSASTWS
jgi:hypothetical protein